MTCCVVFIRALLANQDLPLTSLEEPILQGEECLITDLGRLVLSHSAHNNTNNQYPS